ncbi:MAG: MucBP domain-containing protein, partial [Lactobacillus iners]|nr:MucBP domain-containing protein [Lactobacillus iners]
MNDKMQMHRLIEQKRIEGADKKPRYGMRKLTIGTVSCLLGFASLLAFTTPNFSQAVESGNTGGNNSLITGTVPKENKSSSEEGEKLRAPQDVSGQLENLKIKLSGDNHENASLIHPLRPADDNDESSDQQMKVNFSFDVDGSEIKEGDYFDLNLSENVNLYGATSKKADIQTKLYVGNDVVAKGVYDAENHRMRYTFTKKANEYGHFTQRVMEPVFIDAKGVPVNNKNVDVEASIGSHKSQKEVEVNYDLPVKEGEDNLNSNGNANLSDIDESTGTYKETIYVNNKQREQNNTRILIENGGKNSFTTFDGQVANSIEVYKVKDPSKLSGSMDLDMDNLEKVSPTQYDQKLKADKSGIEINLKNKGTKDVYVVRYNGKYDASKTANIKTTIIADPQNNPYETAKQFASVSTRRPDDESQRLLGSFYDTHIYQTVDKNGNLIRTDYVQDFKHFAEGRENEKYTTEQIPVDGYTLKKAVPANKANCNQDGSPATGNFTAQVTKAVTYYYTKQNDKGFFKAIHVYQTVDDDGNILSTDAIESGNLQSGYDNQQYTGDIKGRDGYTFTHVEDVDGTTKKDQQVTGNFEIDKTKKATFYYQKVVQKGHFKEVHVYITKDKNTGKVTSIETVEGNEKSGLADEQYTTEKKNREGFTLTKVEGKGGHPKFDNEGKKTSANYIVGERQVVQYTYEREVATGTFKETHIYITKDEDGKELARDVITTEPQRGNETEEYTTEKKDREGYTFVKTENPVGDPKYSEKGDQTKGKFVGDKDQAITYVYEKKVKKEVVPEPKKGTFKETHIYRVKYKDGKVISESTSEKIVTGTEKETYTTAKIDKEGFKFIEAKDPKENPSYSETGDSKTGNFKADKEQAITYVYEKEVERPAPNPEPKKGSFKETHIYRVVDEEGKTVSENSTERIVSGNENTEYTTSKVDKEGFTFKQTQDPKENPSYSKTGDSTKGKFVGDKTQEITYVYEKKVNKPAPKPEDKKGTFKETHIYRVKYKDGTVVSESSSERLVSGTEKEKYTTGKVLRDGFTFVKTQDAKEAPTYSQEGLSTQGNFKAEKEQAITYVYEKVIEKPAPEPEAKKGTFKEIHVYRVVDEEGKTVSESSSERVVSGTEKETYTTEKKEKDDFKFVKTQDAKEDPTYSQEGNSKTGNFKKEKEQSITYVYEKKVKKEVPTEPQKGTFKEIHKYITKDYYGNVIGSNEVEKVFTGSEKEKYTTEKKEKDDFKFIEAKDPKESPSYSDKGDRTEGNFVKGKDQEITYVYERKVAPQPKRGTFKETHIYIIKDEKGNIIDTNNTEKMLIGNENEEYTTEKIDKKGYTFVKTQDPVDNPSYSDKGDSTKGKFVGDKDQAITYVYEKTVKNPAPAPEPKKGSFKETHIYRVVDEDGKVISESTSERVVSGTEKEEYTTGKVDKEGYTFKNTQDAKENPKYSEKGEPTKGKFVGDKTQAITYVYEKKVAKPAPAPEPKSGSFKEIHIYVTKDEDGNIVKTEQSENKVKGHDGDEYTTEKNEKDGFKFVKTQDPKDNPTYSTEGKSTTGKIVGNKDQSITYVYEKVVKKEKPTPCPVCPTPKPEPKSGSFKEIHIYVTKDEDGNIVKTEQNENKVKGHDGDEYTTEKNEKD